MGKRSNGEGTVYQRSDGRYEARLTWTDAETGARRSKSFYGATRAEATRKMKAGSARVEGGKPITDARTPLATWIEEWSATALENSDRKPATKHIYRSLARIHLAPAPLGTMPLGSIRPSHVEALTGRMRKAGSSDSTVRMTYTVLRSVLDTAVRDRLIAENVAASVKRPTASRRADGRDEARHMTPAEVRRVLDAAGGTRYAAPLALIAATGLRRGEALAVRWADVNLDAGTLAVTGTLGRVGGKLERSTPKSARSRRTLALTPGVVAVLRRQRVAQLEAKMKAGSRWQDTGYVFTTEIGTPIEPRNVLREFVAAVERAGLDTDGVGLHTLRHSAATGMLDAGVPLHVVSRILGHSSVAITGDIYGHADDARQRDAVDALGAALGL
jgi:integrase